MENSEKSDSYSHILKYTGLFGGVQGLSILVGIIRNKLVAMILGPEGMGLAALFNSTIKLFSDSTNLGIPMSAVRNISEAYEQDDTERLSHSVKIIRSWCLLTALLGALLCIILSPLLNKWTFTWGNHILHFVMLSPVVALLSVIGGELAILKGTRQLKHLAAISLYNVVGAMLISIPIFYEFGMSGIVPSLVLAALLQLVLIAVYSYRLFPFRISLEKSMLAEGLGMVKLGVAFLLAGVLGSGAEFLIRSYLNTSGDLSVVGLYNAGYMMTMTYAGMVFSAMETDYFPRLSGVRGTGRELNEMVNNQVEVSLLLVAPLLVFFMVFLPILLPLLYSGKFIPVLGMMKITVLAMYFRAITLPIEYIPLAKGDSLTYLTLEAVYDILVVAFVIVGYQLWGLEGTGIALAASGFLGLVFDLFYTRIKYHYSFSWNVKLYALIQMPIGLIGYFVTNSTSGISYWIVGILLCIVSLGVSIQILHSKTHLWESIILKLKKKLHRK